MKNYKKGFVKLVLVGAFILLVFAIYFFWSKKTSDPLINEYSEMSIKFDLKYKNFEEAVDALRKITGTEKVFPDRIDFYVPGKIPREDGNPYFIFRSIIDGDKNDCLVGHMNLVSGEVESWYDVCIIYN
jgi:hypothetical protein